MAPNRPEGGGNQYRSVQPGDGGYSDHNFLDEQRDVGEEGNG